MTKNEQLTKMLGEVRYRENLTQGEIASRIGVTQQYLSGVINSKLPFTEELRERLCEEFSYLTTPHTHTREINNVPRTSLTTGRPYYNVDFIGGFDLVMNDQTILPEYNIDFQPYNKDGVLWCNITGHSMEPAIGHGDIIAIKEIQDWRSFLTMGEIYAIVTNNDLRTVKIVRKGSDDEHLRLVPVNTEEYDEQQIEKAQIARVFSVLGCLKKM